MDRNKTCGAGIEWLTQMQGQRGSEVSAIIALGYVLNMANRIQRMHELEAPQSIIDWMQDKLDRRLERLVTFFPYDEELSRFDPVEVGKVLNSELHGRFAPDLN